MNEQIILDLSGPQAVLIQITKSRRGLRIVDAALASSAQFPDAWRESSNSVEQAVAITPSQRRTQLIRCARLLAPEVHGHQVTCILSDADYEYRIDPPLNAPKVEVGQATLESTSRMTHGYWIRAPFPGDAAEFSGLSTGIRIGIHRDVVRDLQRTLRDFQWDLDSVVSPVSVVAQTPSTANDQLQLSIIDGVEAYRVVLHFNGCPLFTRRLRMSWHRGVSDYAVQNPEDWWTLACLESLSRERVNELVFEIQRTIQYIARRCRLPIGQFCLYGSLALDDLLLQSLREQLHCSVLVPAFPENVSSLTGMNAVAPLYALAVQLGINLLENV